jgi:WD40 repeat protein
MNELPETVASGRTGAPPPEELLPEIEAERERRWSEGARVPVEEYFRAHPALAEGELALRLVYGEFLLRERAGEAPSLEEYQRRFPALAARLEQQIALHRALGVSAGDETKVSACKPVLPERPVGVPAVPGFEILGELGRGGMAVVYRARDTKLNRVVALKLIKSGSLPGTDEVRRFRIEAQAVARLHHPNIVQIFEVGDVGDMPYMALEFVPGGTLAQKLRESPLAPRAAAELTQLLARALGVAHRAGVIHRDLKPGNILLAEDGSPRVADFGLAKHVENPDGNTHTGAILGTPSYMAPEQASGNVSAITSAVDVWALGAILYECLTGRPPFKESSVIETLTQVCSRDPVPPSRLLLRVPSELEAVCLKCLEKDPERRYHSAAALADDLQRWLAGKPTLARPVGVLSRCWKLVRRNPVISTAGAVTLMAVLLGAAGVMWYWIQAARERAFRAEAELREQAEIQERRAAEQRAELGRRAEYSRLLGVADRFWQASSIPLSEEALDDCPADLRGCEWHYRRRRNNPGGVGFRAAWDEVASVAISDDGKLIVTGSGDSLRPDAPGTIGLWNAVNGMRDGNVAEPRAALLAVGGAMVSGGLPSTTHTGPIASVAFQPGGATFVTASRSTDVQGILKQDVAAFAKLGGELIVWDTNTRMARSRIPGAAAPAGFSANGKRFAACTQGRIARVWDVNGTEWKELPALAAYPGRSAALALSPDGQRLAVAGYHVTSLAAGSTRISYKLEVYDLATGQKLPNGPAHNGSVECVAFSPDGRTLAAGCEDGVVRQWDLVSGQERARLHGHSNAVTALAFSSDGKWVATGGRDQTVRLWDRNEGTELRTYRGHSGPVWALAFGSTGTGAVLVSGGGDGIVRVWDPARSPDALELPGHGGMVLAVAFSPDRPYLATACRKDAKVRVWNVETGSEVVDPLPARAERIAFGPNGLLASAGGTQGDQPGELIVWDVVARKERFTLIGHKKYVTAIAFTPDGHRLFSAAGNPYGGEAEEVKVWDMTTGKELFAFRPPVGLVTSLAFAPDGKQVAASGYEGAVAVCDPETGRVLLHLPNHPGIVSAVAFSPDGRVIAAGDQQGFLTFRDAGDGRELLRVRAHQPGTRSGTGIQAISYDRTGQRLASASFDMATSGSG